MPERLLIIVEDDHALARTLKRSFERRGYGVRLAVDLRETEAILETETLGYAVVDLKLGNESGLDAVRWLHTRDPSTRIVVLTGYASIATAVNAIKLGACNYLVKPANSDDIEAAFSSDTPPTELSDPVPSTSIKTLEWERIHEVLADTGFNISETARRLGMHRRTLARKLAKRRVK